MMVRRSFIAGVVGALGFGRAKAAPPPARFPPVPAWRPSFQQPIDRIVDRVVYYSNGTCDIAVMRNGTCILIEGSLPASEARTFALSTLANIYSHHPDMSPSPMDDGNILVCYNYPAVNVVLKDVAQAHWAEIEEQYLNGLAGPEVLFTPLGRNKFDDFGKQALLGRAYMFMDAQQPEVVDIRRRD